MPLLCWRGQSRWYPAQRIDHFGESVECMSKVHLRSSRLIHAVTLIYHMPLTCYGIGIPEEMYYRYEILSMEKNTPGLIDALLPQSKICRLKSSRYVLGKRKLIYDQQRSHA